MYPEEAEDALAHLVMFWPDRWDEITFKAWCDEVTTLPDIGAAKAASRLLAREWQQTTLPPFGVWLDNYRRIATRRRDEQNTLPPGGALPTEAGVAWAQRIQRQIAALHPMKMHNHHNGADNCPACSLHKNCEKGTCPRCREIAAIP